ncbi:hypothetical protein [Porphyrobacter sp. HT-58-2]|uniref:hypothetical protein n=1 Tax=Porphyrobacter sp. HT-58-2 TaxID=2023229 RepID=UPI0018F86A85|nr:hypothetical protein [Porphyrobacter sp. HT-58-2]
MLMVNGDYFRAIRGVAESVQFQDVVSVTPDQAEKQRHMELAVRFLVHSFVPYDGKLDVEEYIDEGTIRLARGGDEQASVNLINKTFGLLHSAFGPDALRRYENGTHSGRVGLVALEAIAVGIARNVDAILALGDGDAAAFVKDRIEAFWSQPTVANFTSPGLRGTARIQRTVPFGTEWFKP